jgi:hypothetical protein
MVNGDATTDANYVYWISNPVSGGTRFYKGPWNYCAKVDGTSRLDPVIIPFDLTTGQHFFMKVRNQDALGRVALESISGRITVTHVV